MTQPKFDARAYIDKMAGHALTGLLAANTHGTAREVAFESHAYAYAMLAERERRANPPVENPGISESDARRMMENDKWK